MPVEPHKAPVYVDPERAAYARALSPFLASLRNLQDAHIRVEVWRILKEGAPPRVGETGRALDQMANVVRDASMHADMAARESVLKAADRFRRSGLARPIPSSVRVAAPSIGELPAVPYTEAVADIIAREPRLATSAAEVAQAYGERHAFAVAKSTDLEVTQRVQKAIAKALDRGAGVQAGVKSIRGVAAAAGQDMADWTRSFAETVFRTNMATAYSAGRFRQMADPAVAYAIGALMYDGPTDTPPTGNTRPNHAAAVGLIAAPTDPVWPQIGPPSGYNCRHSHSFVPWGELKRRRLLLPNGAVRPAKLPRGAHPDPGFSIGQRPDILIYGGAV